MVSFIDNDSHFQLSDIEIDNSWVSGQAYSWIDGFATNCVWIPISRIKIIDVFLTEKDWKDAGNRIMSRHEKKSE